MKNKGENLFTIGEIAKAVGITRKIILNYEAKGLIKPDRKDGVSGNRYYTIDTFTQIRTIRIFQDLGLSLDEICGYFNDATDLRPMITRLEEMRDKLNLTIEKLKERSNESEDSVNMITIEPQTVYVRRYDACTVAEKTDLLRETALEAMRLYGTDTTRRMYFTEYDPKEPKKIYCGAAIPSESRGEYVERRTEMKGVAAFHHGAYESISDTRKKLIEYAEQNDISLAGVFRNLYLEGPPQHKDKSKFITQVIAIVK